MTLGTADVGCCGEEHTFELTGELQAALDLGESMISLQLRSADEATVGGVRWWFREGHGVTYNGITGARPAIELAYTVP